MEPEAWRGVQRHGCRSPRLENVQRSKMDNRNEWEDGDVTQDVTPTPWPAGLHGPGPIQTASPCGCVGAWTATPGGP